MSTEPACSECGPGYRLGDDGCRHGDGPAPKPRFYRTWTAFPHSRRDGRADDIVVNVHPNGYGEGGNYEFVIEHTGTEAGRKPIALRVKMFADSWRAFYDLPEFFDLLGELDESQGAQNATTLDDLTPRLLALGWIDRTDEFAVNHEHVIGCLTCGDRIGGAS